MGKVTTITDKESGEIYTLSSINNSKKVFVNKKPYRTLYETALIKGKSPRAKTHKPLCTFELMNHPQSDLSIEEFHNKLINLVEDHGVSELLKDSSIPLYLEEGFYCQMSKPWQLFALSKINIFYLFPLKPDYSKHNHTGEEYFLETTDTNGLSNSEGQDLVLDKREQRWNTFSKIIDDILKQKLLDTDAPSRVNKPRQLSDIANVLAISLMIDACEMTKIQVESYSGKHEKLYPIRFFKMCLAILLQQADRWITVAQGDDKAEAYMLGIHDTILRIWEAYSDKVKADTKATSEIINSFLALCNEISDEFSDDSLYDYDPETAMKGSWPFEAGKKMDVALCGTGKDELRFINYFALSGALTSYLADSMKYAFKLP